MPPTVIVIMHGEWPSTGDGVDFFCVCQSPCNFIHAESHIRICIKSYI